MVTSTHSYRASIKHWSFKQQSPRDVAARIFEVYPARVFEKLYGFDLEFEIKKEISNQIGTGINNIFFCGSAQIGESLHANKPFDSDRSDLDVAIVDSEKFITLGNLVQEITGDFQFLNKFPKLGTITDAPGFYKDNFTNGYIHTFTLPPCDEKREIEDFFRSLESNYSGKFTSISASFYSSLFSFERKQTTSFRHA